MIAFAALLATSMLPQSSQQEPPSAEALWTIGSDDCASVNTDGDSWDECGFQSFDMKSDGSRTLTLSATGIVQLWDDGGRQIAKVDWPDDPSGSGGFPNGEVLIVGKLGVAITHQNQLLILDLTDGKILTKRILPGLLARELRLTRAGRVIAETRDLEWNWGLIEIELATGDLRQVGAIQPDIEVKPSPWGPGMRVIQSGDSAILQQASGKTIARLPLAAVGCAAQPSSDCRLSQDGRKLLVATTVRFPGSGNLRVDLTMHAIPDVGARMQN